MLDHQGCPLPVLSKPQLPPSSWKAVPARLLGSDVLMGRAHWLLCADHNVKSVIQRCAGFLSWISATATCKEHQPFPKVHAGPYMCSGLCLKGAEIHSRKCVLPMRCPDPCSRMWLYLSGVTQESSMPREPDRKFTW